MKLSLVLMFTFLPCFSLISAELESNLVTLCVWLSCGTYLSITEGAVSRVVHLILINCSLTGTCWSAPTAASSSEAVSTGTATRTRSARRSARKSDTSGQG